MRNLKYDTISLTSEMTGYMSIDVNKLQFQQSVIYKANDESVLSELNNTLGVDVGEENKKRRSRADRQKQRQIEGEVSEENSQRGSI